MITPTQEMVLALLLPETINEVKKLFKDSSQIVGFEAFDISFRLFKAEAGNINLEILLQMPIEDGSTENIPGFGKGKIQKMVTFFKPIGFYIQRNGLFSNDIEIKVLREYEEDLKVIVKKYNELSKLKIGTLSLIKNAIIAAFSMEAYMNAMKYEDVSFIANGLSCDIYLTLEGYPQFFLNDKHGISGPMAAYPMREHDFITPIADYTKIFEDLKLMGLMTVFKEDKVEKSNSNKYSDKLLLFIFHSMTREDNEYMYYNAKLNNVQNKINGYLTSMTADDQSSENRNLYHKIMASAPLDLINEGEHFLIPSISIALFFEFLDKNSLAYSKANEWFKDYNQKLGFGSKSARFEKKTSKEFYRDISKAAQTDDYYAVLNDIVVNTQKEIAYKWILKIG